MSKIVSPYLIKFVPTFLLNPRLVLLKFSTFPPPSSAWSRYSSGTDSNTQIHPYVTYLFRLLYYRHSWYSHLDSCSDWFISTVRYRHDVSALGVSTRIHRNIGILVLVTGKMRTHLIFYHKRGGGQIALFLPQKSFNNAPIPTYRHLAKGFTPDMG